ncbi:Crp/Fnr family transcriptional regulator [Thermodesulfovibrio sp. 3907-1M]|uniref:Crp/Fnr family transcriptional regulator n=1 Tax=Thermodesulfovibrio autotrophicus TaxID=3118333 RepID=UPI00338E0C23
MLKLLMLEEIAIFNELSNDDLRNLEKNLTIQSFKKRQVIFYEGDSAEWFYILLKGKVKISKFSADGREIVLEIIDAPDFFGALAVIKNFPYPATAIAIENCEVGKVGRNIFLKVFNKYPGLNNKILHHITMRLRAGVESLKNLALEDVLSRIVYQILKLTTKYGKKVSEGVLIDLKLTKQEIAEMAGTTTETAIRIIGRLKKEGYIVEQNRKIIVKDIDRLFELLKNKL